MNLNCDYTKKHLAIVTGDGKISPCCQYIDNRFHDNQKYYEIKTLDNTNDLNSVLRSDLWKNIRKDLDVGTKINGCRICWKTESTGNSSKRNWANKLFNDDKIILEDLELSLDHTCNMMCRVCRPEQSSVWNAANDVVEKFYNMRPHVYSLNKYVSSYPKKIKKVLDKTDLSHIKNIRLVGGEPFFSKNIDWLINKLYTTADVNELWFAINTNGSVFPKKNVLDKLKQFKKISIDLSIDAIGDLANCIRHGVDWDVVYKNIIKWKDFSEEYKNVKVSIHSTISILNCNKMQEVVDFCETNNLNFSFHKVTDPDFYDLCQLPEEKRNNWKVETNFLDNKMLKELNNCLTKSVPVKNNLYDLESALLILDNHFKIAFEKINPEIWNLIQEYKNYYGDI